MKTIVSKSAIMVAAFGIAAFAAAPAFADQECQEHFGGFISCESSYATDRNGDLTDDEMTNVIDGVAFPGIAVTESAPKPLLDEEGNQVVDDNGRPLYQHTGPFLRAIKAEAYGNNATAIGAGARVGQFVPFKASSCTDSKFDNDKDACERAGETFTPAVNAHTIPANNSTAIGANAIVEHDNSTAIGAGAQSTDDHQVTLGTKDETIRAEGITSQKSKDRQEGFIEVVTSDSGGRLATDGGEIFNRLGSLENGQSANAAAINANTALLSQHSATLDDHAKGLAISMAMPDAWLSDKKRFGIFGAVGGFDGETALGFAAIGRIDNTWSLNAKLGTDINFEQFGFQVGAGAQW